MLFVWGRCLLLWFASWLFGSFFVAAGVWVVAELALLVWWYVDYKSKVLAYWRRDARVLVVFDRAHEVQARELEGTQLRCKLIREEQFDAWDLLSGSQSVVFLVGKGRVLEFLESEAFTRRSFSRENSFKDNMLESAESERRIAFQRLRFMASDPLLSRFLRAFGAQPVSSWQENEQPEGAFGFLDWAFLGGVSTRARRRPSKLRLSHVRKLFHDRLRWEVLTPRWDYWLGPSTRTAAANPTSFMHISKQLAPVPPYACWSCEFGDESLLEGFEVEKTGNFVVGKFRLVTLGKLPTDWEAEFVLGCGAEVFVEIWFEGVVPCLFSVSSEKALAFLQSLRSGDLVELCEWFRFGVAAGLFVEVEERRNKIDTDSFHRLGFAKLHFGALVPFPFMMAMRRYFVEMRKWLALFNSGGSSNTKRFNHGTRTAPGEDLSFRDEPVLRYMNIALTEFVRERVCHEEIVPSSHSVAVFIESGVGFEAHTDASPPFDVTLDLVVDHVGSDHRPISLCPDGKEFVVSCSFGESVIFRGGEISHFGHSLPAGNTHTVALLTWTFCRD
jgi:hypothetical protein